MAFKSLQRQHPKLRYKHLWSSEKAAPCKKIIQAFDPSVQIHDITDKATRTKMPAPMVHLHTPPCQTYAKGGKLKGEMDPRGQLFGKGFEFAAGEENGEKPDASIFECTSNMTCKKFAPIVKRHILKLNKAGVQTRARLLNVADFKRAHQRKRLFVVAINQTKQVRPFKWPKPQPKVTAEMTILGPKQPGDKPGRLPQLQGKSRERAQNLCKRAYATCWKKGIDARKVPILVDVDCSEDHSTFGVNEMRTLLHSRPLGPWISTAGRRTNIDELLRSQGYPTDDSLPWRRCNISERTLGTLLGNGVSLDVLTPVVRNVLKSLGHLL